MVTLREKAIKAFSDKQELEIAERKSEAEKSFQAKSNFLKQKLQALFGYSDFLFTIVSDNIENIYSIPQVEIDGITFVADYDFTVQASDKWKTFALFLSNPCQNCKGPIYTRVNTLEDIGEQLTYRGSRLHPFNGCTRESKGKQSEK